MLPETVYRVTESWDSGPYYRVERDGAVVYEVTGVTGAATFETPSGEVAFRVASWGLTDERYGYVVRDAEGTALGWLADEVPLVGRRLAIRDMEDATLATLGDHGLVGKALYELFSAFDFPLPGRSRLVYRTAEGHPFGRVERTVGDRTATVGPEDVGLDHRLARAALVVLTNAEQFDRVPAADR